MNALYHHASKLVAIGASAGGPHAIETVLSELGADMPPILITQHMPEVFTRAFARRLDEIMALTVVEADATEKLKSGTVYIAPGDRHLIVRRQGLELFATTDAGPPVNRHRPSVDVLFESVVSAAPASAMGIILTGMGNDGARGLAAMRHAGFLTIAQDEATSVVWGMPREAVKLEAVDGSHILPLSKIGPAIKNFVKLPI